MRRLVPIEATLILALVAAIATGCGGGDDESPVLAEDLADMEQFIPKDLNAQLRRDGTAFRVRSIKCAPQGSTFAARCDIRGNEGRSYVVEVDVKPSDGSYTYSCPKCP